MNKSILLEAEGLVNGERAESYGPVKDTFTTIVEVFNAFRGHKLIAADFAWIMVIAKLVREAQKHKRDNLVDSAGYLELLNRLEEQELPF